MFTVRLESGLVRLQTRGTSALSKLRVLYSFPGGDMKSFMRCGWISMVVIFMVAVIIGLNSGGVVFAQAPGQEAEPALEGLDPVLLVQGKEVQGNVKIAVTRGQFQYYFANEEDKAAFEKEPSRYEIQLGGMCAKMGAPVSGNPDLYTVHKNRIYIFGSGECKTRFEAAPEKYVEDANVIKLSSTLTAEAYKKGSELIEKAVLAMGSPTLIDGLVNFQEKSLSLQTRRGADVEIKSNVTLAFPDKVRTEQTQPDFVNPTVMRETTVVMTANDVFAVTPNGVRTMRDAYRVDQRHELKRRPLAIVRARKTAGFTAAAVGTAKVGETAVEQVALEIDGSTHTLGIEPATGRIISLSYRRRGPGGDFGQVVKVFSDFREVNGVTLPFKVAATFNGQPWKEQSSAIELINLNGKLDPALFERPKQQ
jgi:YHS domain-containing protein